MSFERGFSKSESSRTDFQCWLAGNLTLSDEDYGACDTRRKLIRSSDYDQHRVRRVFSHREASNLSEPTLETVRLLSDFENTLEAHSDRACWPS